MRDIDLSGYEPHWGLGHPTADRTTCPWCNNHKREKILCVCGHEAISHIGGPCTKCDCKNYVWAGDNRNNT